MIPKYKAWDKEDKEMLEVHGINFDAQGIWTNEMIDDESDGNFIFLDEVELMQSIRIKDRKGVEIFESHIIEFEDEFMELPINESDACDGYEGMNRAVVNVDLVKGIYLSDFMIGNGGVEEDFDTFDKDAFLKDSVVVGNIYQHPHLLEE